MGYIDREDYQGSRTKFYLHNIFKIYYITTLVSSIRESNNKSDLHWYVSLQSFPELVKAGENC